MLNHDLLYSEECSSKKPLLKRKTVVTGNVTYLIIHRKDNPIHNLCFSSSNGAAQRLGFHYSHNYTYTSICNFFIAVFFSLPFSL